MQFYKYKRSINGLSLFLFIFIGFLGSCNNDNDKGKDVYICTGKGAYAYHKSPRCPSMVNNCTKEIKRVSLRNAKRMKRIPCKKCYPSS